MIKKTNNSTRSQEIYLLLATQIFPKKIKTFSITENNLSETSKIISIYQNKNITMKMSQFICLATMLFVGLSPKEQTKKIKIYERLYKKEKISLNTQSFSIGDIYILQLNNAKNYLSALNSDRNMQLIINCAIRYLIESLNDDSIKDGLLRYNNLLFSN